VTRAYQTVSGLTTKAPLSIPAAEYDEIQAVTAVERFCRKRVAVNSIGVSEVVQKGAKRFVRITILAGYTLCSCPLGRLGGH